MTVCEHCNDTGGHYDKECEDHFHWCEHCDAAEKHYKKKKLRYVLVFENLMVAAFNEMDNQVVELQTETLLEMLISKARKSHDVEGCEIRFLANVYIVKDGKVIKQ